MGEEFNFLFEAYKATRDPTFRQARLVEMLGFYREGGQTIREFVDDVWDALGADVVHLLSGSSRRAMKKEELKVADRLRARVPKGRAFGFLPRYLMWR